MNFNELTEREKIEYEEKILERANNFWIENYGKQEATDINKLRFFSRQGKIQDQFMHDIVNETFRKHGLWHDGKTTLEERRKQLEVKKAEYGKRVVEIRNSKVKNIDHLIEKAKKRKDELMTIPNRFREEYNIEREKILENLQSELDRITETYSNSIKTEMGLIIDPILKMMESKGEELINDAMDRIDSLQKKLKAKIENGVKQFTAELEAEMSVLEYKEQDNIIIDQYNEEIKEINREINELEIVEGKIEQEQEEIEIDRQEDVNIIEDLEFVEESKDKKNLEDYTVSELRRIAESNGIQLPNKYIQKADLIEIIGEE